MIRVELATGRTFELLADGWTAQGEVLTVTIGGQSVASFRNWLCVEQMDGTPPAAGRRRRIETT